MTREQFNARCLDANVAASVDLDENWGVYQTMCKLGARDDDFNFHTEYGALLKQHAGKRIAQHVTERLFPMMRGDGNHRGTVLRQ